MPETLVPPGDLDFRAPRTDKAQSETFLISEEDLPELPPGEEVAEAETLPYYLTPETKATLDHLTSLSTQELQDKGLDDVMHLIFQLKQHAEDNYRDTLTKGANRKAFEAEVEREKKRERIPGEDTFAFMVDVDNFKQYNTYLSHTGGDRALQHLFDQMQIVIDNQKRPYDFAGRYGGDEFAMVARDMKTEEDAVLLGKRLIDRLAENWIELPISWVEPEKHDAMREYVREVTEKEQGFVDAKLKTAQESEQPPEEITKLEERLAQIDARLSNLDTTDVLEVPLRVSVGIGKVEEDSDLLKAFKRGNLANNDIAKSKKVAGEEYTVATYSEWLQQQNQVKETPSPEIRTEKPEHDNAE